MPAAAPAGGDLLAQRYRLIDRVGAGGMSVVWRARDEVLDRLVAVKWLGSELADDDLFRDLVRREAWATARIKHPAVAAVYDYGEVSDINGQSRAYVVMEMLDGESLSERLRLGPLPWREAVAIGAEVADALATTHEQGVVHRDISPDNVMLTSSGLRLFDFGIAAPIGEPDDDATGSTFGTPAYVAPERLDGRPAQTATDVYSLGVLIFEMLTGNAPFPEDAWDGEAALREREPPRLRGVSGLPAAVGRLCQRCLAYDPAARPPARDVADRLAAYARAWWQNRVVAALAVVLVLVVAAVAVLASWLPPDTNSRLADPGETTTPKTPGPGTRTDDPAVAPSGSTATTPGPAGTESGPAGGPGTGTATTGATPGGSAPPNLRTGAPPKPVNGQPPAVESVTVEQSLNDLRTIIADGLANGEIRTDVGLDLRQQVNNIGSRLAFTPNADKTVTLSMVDNLRRSIQDRSVQDWPADAGTTAPPGRMALSSAVTNQLLAAVARLRTAVS
jgi:eukaryotic-like serine/threonine-protein kinase